MKAIGYTLGAIAVVVWILPYVKTFFAVYAVITGIL